MAYGERFHGARELGLRLLVPEWLAHAENLVQVQRPATIHIDELVEIPADAAEYDVALDAYRELVRALHGRQDVLTPALAIALESTQRLSLWEEVRVATYEAPPELAVLPVESMLCQMRWTTRTAFPRQTHGMSP